MMLYIAYRNKYSNIVCSDLQNRFVFLQLGDSLFPVMCYLLYDKSYILYVFIYHACGRSTLFSYSLIL